MLKFTVWFHKPAWTFFGRRINFRRSTWTSLYPRSSQITSYCHASEIGDIRNIPLVPFWANTKSWAPQYPTSSTAIVSLEHRSPFRFYYMLVQYLCWSGGFCPFSLKVSFSVTKRQYKNQFFGTKKSKVSFFGFWKKKSDIRRGAQPEKANGSRCAPPWQRVASIRPRRSMGSIRRPPSRNSSSGWREAEIERPRRGRKK